MITLLRNPSTSDGTQGWMELNGVFRLATAEEEWLQNKPEISCIPAGEYVLVRTLYHKHNYLTYEVTGVPGRSHILIHPGNTEEDTMGCILVGTEHAMVRVKEDEDTHAKNVLKAGVGNSRAGFQQFMRGMGTLDHVPFTVAWAQAA